MLRAISILLFAAIVDGRCDNQCSGHGTCMTDDVCKCYDNWGLGLSMDSGDCSDRICPFEIAWVDTPSKLGSFHKYSECASRGICDRTTGECQCFDGYEGKGCQRTSCPNDCSGHGTCEYIDDMGYAATWNDFTNKYFHDATKHFPYPVWDSKKTRGCVCDAKYGDFDCSKKLCPYGTDVLDARDNLERASRYQVQQIVFTSNEAGANDLQRQTFALTFKSRLNETFTTIPIAFDHANIPDFVHDVQLALLNLPNRVIDGITVAANKGYKPGNVGSAGPYVELNVTFTGAAVQGPQHLIIVEDYECAAGCTPKISGLDLQTRRTMQSSNITELQLSDFNSYECGRRGKCDYATGLCSCFEGYVGENCNTQTTLV